MFGYTVLLFSSESFGQSHCRPDEMDFFSCSIKGSQKVMSLCGRKVKYVYETGGLEGNIQYRFGYLGRPELIYPKEIAGSMTKFKGFWDVAGPIKFQELSFQNQGVQYTIVSDTNLRPTDIELFTGVQVQVGTKKTRFSCDKWLAPRKDYSIDLDSPSDFDDLVKALDITAN